jgi:spore maturation protein SpmA
MALTYIWSAFFIVGSSRRSRQWIFLGDVNAFKRIVDGTFESARFAVMDIALPLAGVMTLWMGILAIGEKAGAIDFVARLIGAVLLADLSRRSARPPGQRAHRDELLGQLPRPRQRRHPIGLKAMESLQTLNPTRTRRPTRSSCSSC